MNIETSLQHCTCICQYIWITVLFVFQLQEVTEPCAIIFYYCCQVRELVRTPNALHEETECVATLMPVVGAIIPAQSRHHPHRCVGVFSIIQVGSIWRTLLQSKRNTVKLSIYCLEYLNTSVNMAFCTEYVKEKEKLNLYHIDIY